MTRAGRQTGGRPAPARRVRWRRWAAGTWLVLATLLVLITVDPTWLTPLIGGVMGGLMLLLGILGSIQTALAWRDVRGRNRLLQLRCPWCGFDIRAQAGAGDDRCPECGRALGLGRWLDDAPVTGSGRRASRMRGCVPSAERPRRDHERADPNAESSGPGQR